MSATVRTIHEAGLQAIPIDIECHISNGLPTIIIVGFGNKAVDEAKERMRSAFAESSTDLPRRRITINLAPADLPKDGTAFDLPMAAAILRASNQIPEASDADSTITIGELGLDGTVRPVRGIIGKLLAGRRLGHTTFYIPAGNLAQAVLVPGITLIPVATLNDYYLDQAGTIRLARHESGVHPVPPHTNTAGDFADIVGQPRAKRALEIAAAGNHNVLLNGPPGTGKSMLAKALPSIMPAMSLDESLEVTHLHSLTTHSYDCIIYERPLRTPHHTASEIAIMGGGQNPRPGEVSLAHRGVLFLDELPEYSRAVIEALRQPLEDKTITVARARDTVTYPADFMLVATSNPCPCGYYGSSKPCKCLPADIVRYQRKLSGPILDRIDIYVTVDEIEHTALLGSHTAEPSQAVKKRINRARTLQAKRYDSPTVTNASLSNTLLKQHAPLSPEAKQLLDHAAAKLGISARSYMRTVKVARTIADLDGHDTIGVTDVSEALQYRHQTHS